MNEHSITKHSWKSDLFSKMNTSIVQSVPVRRYGSIRTFYCSQRDAEQYISHLTEGDSPTRTCSQGRVRQFLLPRSHVRVGLFDKWTPLSPAIKQTSVWTTDLIIFNVTSSEHTSPKTEGDIYQSIRCFLGDVPRAKAVWLFTSRIPEMNLGDIHKGQFWYLRRECTSKTKLSSLSSDQVVNIYQEQEAALARQVGLEQFLNETHVALNDEEDELSLWTSREN